LRRSAGRDRGKVPLVYIVKVTIKLGRAADSPPCTVLLHRRASITIYAFYHCLPAQLYNDSILILRLIIAESTWIHSVVCTLA